MHEKDTINRKNTKRLEKKIQDLEAELKKMQGDFLSIKKENELV